MARADAIDYIVVHEMCHMDYRDHSKNFWNRVEEIMPNYKEKHEWLKINGMNLYLWENNYMYRPTAESVLMFISTEIRNIVVSQDYENFAESTKCKVEQKCFWFLRFHIQLSIPNVEYSNKYKSKFQWAHWKSERTL